MTEESLWCHAMEFSGSLSSGADWKSTFRDSRKAIHRKIIYREMPNLGTCVTWLEETSKEAEGHCMLEKLCTLLEPAAYAFSSGLNRSQIEGADWRNTQASVKNLFLFQCLSSTIECESLTLYLVQRGKVHKVQAHYCKAGNEGGLGSERQ